MNYASAALPNVAGAYPSASLSDVLQRSPSLARKFVEFVFYCTTANSMILSGMGLTVAPLVSGAAILLGGSVAVLIMTLQRERLPFIFWMGLLINLGAGFSQQFLTGQIPFIGGDVRFFLLWLSSLMMAYYIIQNEAARKRVILFFCVVILAMVRLSGGSLSIMHTKRLDLKGVFTGVIADSNSLSYCAGLLCVLLLFWSLRSAKWNRPLLWSLAAVMALVVIRTVSRSGMLALACGLAVLACAILLGRGVRLSGIVLVLVAMVAGSVLVSIAGESIGFFEQRLDEHSIRAEVYQWGTVKQMGTTLLVGDGPGVRSVAGISAHNAFIYTHLAFGGITSVPYAFLIVVLWLRTARLVASRELPLDIRFMVLAVMGMTFAFQMFSNLGYVYIESILALAIVANYTQPYSRRASRVRREQRNFAYGSAIRATREQYVPTVGA